MAVTYQTDGRVIKLSGVINESFTERSFEEAIKPLKDENSSSPVYLDLIDVQHSNSQGMLTWRMALMSASVPLVLQNIPVWLVEVFNMWPNYLSGIDVCVESIQASFYDPDTEQVKVCLLNIGKDIPILTDYSDYEYPEVQFNGRTLEPEFDPSVYFTFLTDLAPTNKAS